MKKKTKKHMIYHVTFYYKDVHGTMVMDQKDNLTPAEFEEFMADFLEKGGHENALSVQVRDPSKSDRRLRI